MNKEDKWTPKYNLCFAMSFLIILIAALHSIEASWIIAIFFLAFYVYQLSKYL